MYCRGTNCCQSLVPMQGWEGSPLMQQRTAPSWYGHLHPTSNQGQARVEKKGEEHSAERTAEQYSRQCNAQCFQAGVGGEGKTTHPVMSRTAGSYWPAYTSKIARATGM
jgi:hypothetical protein